MARVAWHALASNSCDLSHKTHNHIPPGLHLNLRVQAHLPSPNLTSITCSNGQLQAAFKHDGEEDAEDEKEAQFFKSEAVQGQVAKHVSMLKAKVRA